MEVGRATSLELKFTINKRAFTPVPEQMGFRRMLTDFFFQISIPNITF